MPTGVIPQVMPPHGPGPNTTSLVTISAIIEAKHALTVVWEQFSTCHSFQDVVARTFALDEATFVGVLLFLLLTGQLTRHFLPTSLTGGWRGKKLGLGRERQSGKLAAISHRQTPTKPTKARPSRTGKKLPH